MNEVTNNNLLEICKEVDPSHLVESDADHVSEYNLKKNQFAIIKEERR